MRRVLSLWWMLAILLGGLAWPVRAADPDAASPLVSYLYLDTLAETPSQPNVVSPLVSYLYLDTIADPPSQPNVGSLPVSYLYLDSLVKPPDQPNVVSPLVSYLFYDWVGDANLAFQSSLPVSFYFHPSTTSGPITLLGQVTDANGLTLSGVTVSAAVGLKPVAQTTTDVSGNYALPPLDAGVYALTASASGHARSARVLTLSAGTAVQDFRLSSLLSAPSQQAVTRTPTVTYTTGPLDSKMKLFDGTQFLPIPDGTPLPTARTTIVLTHGWINSLLAPPNGIEDWPTRMATQLRTNGVTADEANIIAWDWRTEATGKFPPQVATPRQGAALGTNLMAALGPNYSRPIHFIGHSLGTMVNAAAINFLHGERPPSTLADVSLTSWPPDSKPFIHVTLFDEAAEATADTTASQVFFDGNTVSQSPSPALQSADNNTSLKWSPSLPLHFTWADNYVSLFGFYHSRAVNALLQRGIATLGNVHSYPQYWYGLSIVDSSHPTNPLGHKQSFEYLQNGSLPLSGIPPTGLSDAYWQSSQSDQLELSPIPPGLGPYVVSAFGVTAGSIVHGVDNVVQFTADAMQFAGDVETTIRSAAQTTAQAISSGMNYVGNVALQGGQAVVNIFSWSVQQLKLHTLLASVPNPATLRGGPRTQGDGDGSSSNSPPMVWLPIRFPTSATAMAFDFTLEGNPMDDALVCGIGETNLFSLQAKYIPTNTMSASRLIDVSAWAGTTNELFFGFLGGTSTNATLTIENIRFYSLEVPRLQITQSGSLTLLTWPTTAGGYVVETTPTLSLPNWEAMTNAPAILADRYVLTNSWSDQSRFFRLRQR